MKTTIEVAGLTAVLFFSLGPIRLGADDLVVQKSGYVREVGAMRETLEFNGQKMTQLRDVYNIPEGFGRLLTITPGGEGVVFWFQNEQGEIRNVSIPANTHLVVLRKGKIVIEPGLNG